LKKAPYQTGGIGSTMFYLFVGRCLANQKSIASAISPHRRAGEILLALHAQTTQFSIYELAALPC
jgi:hypothetical protein